MSRQATPLAMNVHPDPLILERAVSRRQLASVLEKGNNGNGHDESSANGNGGQALEPTSLDFAPVASNYLPAAQTPGQLLPKNTVQPAAEPDHLRL